MIRILGAVGLVLGLSGCVTTGGEAWWRAWTAATPMAGQYHFDWQLSGDADLAPLQVFDDGRETWLQYPADQAAPALFSRTAAGDRLLQARRVGDYLVLRGVPDHLLMRGGLLQAEARRVTAATPAPAAEAAESTSLSAVAAVPLALPTPPPPPPPSVTQHSPLSTTVLVQDPSPQPVVAQSPPLPPAVARRPAPPAAVGQNPQPQSVETQGPQPRSTPPSASRPFEVTPADGNVRRALARWAGVAGWTFEAEHWAVDVDIPLAGSAMFDDAFRPAVRGLLAATELGDRPLQPCFYANRVLRVVPLAQRCDRTQAPGGES